MYKIKAKQFVKIHTENYFILLFKKMPALVIIISTNYFTNLIVLWYYQVTGNTYIFQITCYI